MDPLKLPGGMCNSSLESPQTLAQEKSSLAGLGGPPLANGRKIDDVERDSKVSRKSIKEVRQSNATHNVANGFQSTLKQYYFHNTSK